MDGEQRAWREVQTKLQSQHLEACRRARLLYDLMSAHVMAEACRTGAELLIYPPGSVLPKSQTTAAVALRMDVTEGTALYARQPHARETREERHRSWRISLDDPPRMPDAVRRGLTRMVEEVAALQGHESWRAQGALTLD